MPEPKTLSTKSILQVLRKELALQTRHCTLLEAQEKALLACDRALFATLQSEHAEMLLEIQAQDAERRTSLRDEEGVALTISALKQQTPASSLPVLTALEDSLRRTVDRVQALMRRNQMLIQNELEYLAFTLDLFVEAGRSADKVYGGGRRIAGRLLLDQRA